MQEVTKEMQTVITKQTVYVAEDGTEFRERHECLDYEWRKFKKPLLAKLQRAEKADGLSNFSNSYTSDDYDYTWYKINTQEDADIIEEVYGISVEVGKWVCIEDTNDDYYDSTLEDGLEYVKKLLDALGYEFEVREKGGDADGYCREEKV